MFEWLRNLSPQSRTTPSTAALTAGRFFLLFQAHGVAPTQIPRLFPDLPLGTLANPESLLTALSPALIDQVATFFGVRPEWLDGVDNVIYDYRSCYKQPRELLTVLRAVVSRGGPLYHFTLRAVTTAKPLNRHDQSEQPLALILVEPIAELGEETVFRYHVYRDVFDWSHPPCRYQLKATAQLAFRHLRCQVPLFVISKPEMSALVGGTLIPHKLLDRCLLTTPSLEDYALSLRESGAAQETDELPEVQKFIQDYDLESVFTAPLESMDNTTPPAAVTVTQEQPASTTAREDTQAMWEPIRNAARGIWLQAPLASYAEVVEQLKQLKDLPGAHKAADTIYRHIQDLAPDEVRGKRGRKKKNSDT